MSKATRESRTHLLKRRWLLVFPGWDPDAQLGPGARAPDWVVAWVRLRMAWSLPVRAGGAALGESMAEMQAAYELAEFFEASAVQSESQVSLRPEGIRWELSEAAKEILLKQWKAFRRSMMGVADVQDALAVEEFLSPSDSLDGEEPLFGLVELQPPTVDEGGG
jgi:hypothetical protein